jgi:hypothetical protein
VNGYVCIVDQKAELQIKPVSRKEEKRRGIDERRVGDK